MREAGPPPQAPLPAPYESPWRGLRRSLQAVAADLALGLRRLWRLRPALVLLVSLALVAALLLAGFGLRRLARRAAPPAAPATAPAVSTAIATAPAAAPAPATAPATPPATDAAPSGPAGAASVDGAADAPPGAEVPTGAEPAPATAPSPEPAPAPAPPPDPLAEAFAAEDPAGWITAIHADPERGLLALTLVEPPPAGDPRLRRRLERWQELALGLGYGGLELRRGDGSLLARNALVGSGMILLDPAFSP